MSRIESAQYSKHKDTIILQFPTDKYNLDDAEQIYKQMVNLFPDNNILCLPEDIFITILREENPFL